MAKAKTISWERFEAEEIEKRLNTDFKYGLKQKNIPMLQNAYGKNVLEEGKTITITKRIVDQFKSPLVFILLLAGLAALVLGAFLDTIVIFVALLINVIVGTLQEERASKAFKKLNESQEKFATVIRDSKKMVVLSSELVPGDIIILEGGANIPADVRILKGKDLSINESVLTGEWVAVSKEVGVIKDERPLSGRFNMAWMGTLVSSGYGRGVVVETGHRTQVGEIAESLGTIDERVTPLRQNIRTIARFLVYIITFAIAVIFILGLLRGEPLGSMLLIAIAIAVATIPAGLPAAVTVVLALGMESILKRGGLVRNLLAAETLGATTVVLTDKTGTLTEAKMKLADIYTFESISHNSKKRTVDDKALLSMAIMASDAFVEESKEKAEDAPASIVAHGRPIEKAVVLGGLEAGLSQDELEKENERLDFLQFESSRRFGASLNKLEGQKTNRVYFTGSPEYLLKNATRIYSGGKTSALSKKKRELFTAIQKRKSHDGMRFIGVSYRNVKWDTIPEEGEEERKNLTEKSVFVGFMAFIDPIRDDVAESIAKVRKAGAHVIMLTGDNPDTAKRIAVDVGIAVEGDRVLTGMDIKNYDDRELFNAIKITKVFARVLPDQKLRIAQVLMEKGEVVAMTGDGINDAPALRRASIGIAVGSGTEVAKEASDMVLLNNSFSIIVSAIEEGRKIIDNLKKIIAYLFSTSFSEIFIIGVALAAGAPLPLLPAQILWANIIEEGLMSFSFAFEKKDPKLMQRNPRDSASKNILTWPLKKLIFTVGIVTGIFLITLYFILLKLGLPIEEVRTMMFVALSLDSIFFAFSIKSLDTPLWKINIFSNMYLVFALLLSILLLLAAITFSPLQTLLSLVPLSSIELAFLFGIGLLNLATIEVAKYYIFERRVVR